MTFRQRKPLPRVLVLAFVLLGLCVALFSAPAAGDDEPKTVRVELADGFDFPCGNPVGSGEGYYIFRGWTAGHPGEDWNGTGMGNTDLGDPVYSVAKGVVVMSKTAGGGWGNTVIVRHAYRNPRTGMIDVVDSFYTHLQQRTVRVGQVVDRGDQVGTIGTNNGMYVAHLHFEMRHGPGLNIGTHRGRFPRDMRHYLRPKQFIEQTRQLRPERRTRASINVGAFAND